MDEHIISKIQALYLSCNEALTGQWDKSDDGFIAMADDLEIIMNYLNIEIPEIEEVSEND